MQHTARFIGVAAAGIAGLLFLGTVVGAPAAGVLNVINPEAAHQGPVQVPPRLAPPASVAYTPLSAGMTIVSPSGHPVAQLAPVPADLGQPVSVYLPQFIPMAADRVSYEIVGSVRYVGSGHTVVVSTAMASPKAAQIPTLLGGSSTQLADGTPAWVDARPKDNVPDQLTFVRDGLIVTVAGDLPAEALRGLADHVVLK